MGERKIMNALGCWLCLQFPLDYTFLLFAPPDKDSLNNRGDTLSLKYPKWFSFPDWILTKNVTLSK
ncbi:unnamed protein product [Gulo gulo]|uniref:Uncharacterized protein n=1 Tax=Gulo gulo TaxID=48420 RepID=A0A9X9LFK6_GULGU|nr:unnamed protein product [Gulo gulo]